MAMGVATTYGNKSDEWWEHARERYENGEISLERGARLAGVCRHVFRGRLVAMGAKIRDNASGTNRAPVDAVAMDALVARYAANEPGTTLVWLAAEACVSEKRAREEVIARGVPIRKNIRFPGDVARFDRPPSCRRCGFLIGGRCQCPRGER